MRILGTLIGSLYFLFGVESRSQQFLYLSAMTYGINDVHFIFATMLSEGTPSSFQSLSTYFPFYQLAASLCFCITAIIILQTYNSPGDCIFGGIGGLICGLMHIGHLVWTVK
ncbi:hypothetical protein IscW_ISCW004403 [Ixodes scapularis]|uniref:Uncharacterized protein n=1 Tax=Ixodes scapularis TaxID=6945 RepID=B7PF65_IXOSC|nr:hypothetical protein IscW_ISCW004403 [Ixodes scapularis]|eukprot:XP_002433837.1 hypothetical protein IscW_ISCW004403 [Ixodes scapularis]